MKDSLAVILMGLFALASMALVFAFYGGLIVVAVYAVKWILLT